MEATGSMKQATVARRICHVITRLSVGGAQENTLLTCEGQLAAGHQVELVLGSDDGTEGELLSRAKAHGVPLVVVPELMRAISPLEDLRALGKLTDLFRERRYDIVHTHMAKAGVLGRLAARRAGVPLVVHTVHAAVYHEFMPTWQQWAIKALKRHLAKRTDYLINVSRCHMEQHLRDGIGRPDAYATVYSGMELDWFLNAQVDVAAVRREWGVPDDALVVGKVARLVYWKGHAQLLPALPAVLAAVPNVWVVFVGDGAETAAVRAQAEELGVAHRVVFAGFVDRERIPEMVGAMDVLVHTGRKEGLPRVLPQALAMGKPVVSYNLDGAPEVVLPDETGFLVPHDDTEALSTALIRLLSDAALRARFGAAGRAVVDPRFRAETMVADIAAIYEQAWARKFGRQGAS